MTRLESTFHDEETLGKVYDSLLKYKVSPKSARDIVSDMQNRGLLFRERPPGSNEPTPNVPILQFFSPTGWRLESGVRLAVIQTYFDFALNLAEELDDGPEKTVALRKLLESMDAALRTTSE